MFAHLVGQGFGQGWPPAAGLPHRWGAVRRMGFLLRRRLWWSPSFVSWSCRTARERIPGGYWVVLIYLFDPVMSEGG